MEYRSLPGEDAEAVLGELRNYAVAQIEPAMRSRDRNACVLFEKLASVPPLVEHIAPKLQHLIGTLDASPHEAVSYGTEAGQSQAAGIPTIICGRGSIEQAHRSDEYVELAELSRCEKWLDKLLERFGDYQAP